VREHAADVDAETTSVRSPRSPGSPMTLGAGSADRASAIIGLQRSAGNRATSALILARQVVTIPEVTITGEPTDKEQIKAIQRQLRRLRLYEKGIDGISGFFTEQGLTEAFGGDEWQALSDADVLSRLQAAARPPAGGGHQLRYAELFKDGVLDITLGFGYTEGELEGRTDMAAYSRALPVVAGTALTGLGFTDDLEGARTLLGGIGRPIARDAIGAFYVKRAAFTYAPVAGTPRSIDVVVRVISDADGRRGGEALAAFVDAMASGDVAYYIGHGRYGSGPDFDQDYVIRLKDDSGNVTQVLDDHDVLEHILEREGDPWTVFQRRVSATPPTIEVEVTDAGNLWLNARNAHPHEFGARLMYWALEHGTRVATGPGGQLEQATAASSHRYRVIVFHGCRTQDYDRSLRATSGFGTREADIIETNRPVHFIADAAHAGGVEVQPFMAFLRDLMAQDSGEKIVRDMGAVMQANEPSYTGNPYLFSGLGDNPLR
jgi:hypothetical protein